MHTHDLLERVIMFLDLYINEELVDIMKKLVHSLEKKSIHIDKNKIIGIVLFAHKLHRNTILDIDFDDLKDALEIDAKYLFFQAAEEEMEKVRKDLDIPNYSFFHRYTP